MSSADFQANKGGAGRDLGKLSLPIIRGLRGSSGERLKRLLSDSSQTQEAIELLNSCGAVEESRLLAKHMLRSAFDKAKHLLKVDKRTELDAFCDFVLERKI